MSSTGVAPSKKKQYKLKNQRGNQFTNQHKGLG